MVTASDREGHWVAEKIERYPTWPAGTRHADPHRMDPGHLRIFIVEDDLFQLETLQEVLEVAGHTVRGTDRGTVALRWLEEGEPCDLLIMDLGMPDMDGPSLYRAVKLRWGLRAPRALFVSGYADLGPFGDDPDANAVPLLFKPFTLGDLFSALTRALAEPGAS